MVSHIARQGQQVAVLLALALSLPAATVAQQSSAPPIQPAPRALTLTAGLGNAMGWFGAQAERYVRDERLGLFAGFGYVPAAQRGAASGPTIAAGVRTYTNGQKHRAFLEASISQIAVELSRCFDDCARAYGPGLQLGYQFVGSAGFSCLASAGVGYAPSIPDGISKVQPLLGLGLGYTWRR
jgi:hypothetical protein